MNHLPFYHHTNPHSNAHYSNSQPLDLAKARGAAAQSLPTKSRGRDVTEDMDPTDITETNSAPFTIDAVSPLSGTLNAVNTPRGRNSDRMIPGYATLPPHLVFSGATDGWIRVWFWDIDSHSIQLVERLAIHQSGVNAVSASWLDPKFMRKTRGGSKTPVPTALRPSDSPNLSPTPPPTASASHGGNDGLLMRRLAVLTGGDDQSLALIVADFESTMSMSRAARKRAKQQRLYKKSSNSASSTFNRVTGWRFNVIREIPVNTAHVASVRSVALTPIVTPSVVEYFGQKMDGNEMKRGDDDGDGDDDRKEMELR